MSRTRQGSPREDNGSRSLPHWRNVLSQRTMVQHMTGLGWASSQGQARGLATSSLGLGVCTFSLPLPHFVFVQVENPEGISFGNFSSHLFFLTGRSQVVLPQCREAEAPSGSSFFHSL